MSINMTLGVNYGLSKLLNVVGVHIVEYMQIRVCEYICHI